MSKKQIYAKYTIRELFGSTYPGVLWCESHVGCKKGLSAWVHNQGRVDSFGVIHFSRGQARADRRTMHYGLRLIAQAVDRSIRTAQPWFVKEYRSSRWAYDELFKRFRRKAGWDLERKRRASIARVKGLRYRYPVIYNWAHAEKRYADRNKERAKR